MKLNLICACAAFALISTSAAQATTYLVDYSNASDSVIGTVTTNAANDITAFSGAASGFGGNPIFNGPLTLATSAGSSGFTFDNKWVGGKYGIDTVGMLLTNGAFYIRIYDYTDTYNDYGVQAAWFGSSGYNPVTFSGAAVPEPTTWALLLMGLGGVGAMLRRGRRTARPNLQAV